MLIDYKNIKRFRNTFKDVTEYFDFCVKDYKTGKYIAFNIEDINNVECIDDLVTKLSIKSHANKVL